MIRRRYLAVAVLAGICVFAVLVAAIPTWSSPGDHVYNPWADINGDGQIDGKDLTTVAVAFGSWGQNITKAGLQYDSGWINITDKCGQSITVTHNLTIADWNDPNMTVDITGKTTPTSGLLRFLGLTGQQGWNSTYGGAGDDWAWSLVQTWDGGYALAGSTTSFGAGGTDFWLVKTDASGNHLWNKTYGGTGWDEACSVVQTGDGGYALAGDTTSFGADGDFWLVKTDSNGNMQWNQTYGGIGSDEAYSLVQTGDGGYALAGIAWPSGAGVPGFWLVKTDASGNMQWNSTYRGTDGGEAFSLVQTDDGGYAIAGLTWPSGALGDFWLIKTDASGNMQWNNTYGGAGHDWAYSLVQTWDGGYAIAGTTYSSGAGGGDFWLVKTDSNGNMQWNSTYGGTSEDYAWSLVQTGDGGYALAGATWSFGAGGTDFWLVKTDASGNMQWNNTYGGTSDDATWSLVQTWDGGYALAGSTTSFGVGLDDFWLVKTDASGNIGEAGLVWVGSTSNTIRLYRGAADPCWNYVRVQIWKRK